MARIGCMLVSGVFVSTVGCSGLDGESFRNEHEASALTGCVNAPPGGGFMNTPFTSQFKGFTARFSATPGAANMDGVVGLSEASAMSFGQLAAAVRFAPEGIIDVRNGDVYATDDRVMYVPGASYSFTVIVDVCADSYSVLGANRLLAKNYGFRTQQVGVASLGNFAAISDSAAGSLEVCAFDAQTSPELAYLHDVGLYGSGAVQSIAVLPDGTPLVSFADRTIALDALGRATREMPYGGFLALDAQGNIYLVGTFVGSYDGGGEPITSSGGVDIYISKYSSGFAHLRTLSAGTEADDVWSSATVNAGGELALRVNSTIAKLSPSGGVRYSLDSAATGIALDDAGNALLVENVPGAIVVEKLDASGTSTLWRRSYPFVSGSAHIERIVSDHAGNALLFGNIGGTVDFDGSEFTAHVTENGARAFVAKISSAGSFVYASLTTMDDIRAVGVDARDNAYVSGERANPGFFRVNQFSPTGALVEKTGFDVVPPFDIGSSGAFTVDATGNLYWEIHPRFGGSSLSYLTKLAAFP